MRYKIKFSQKPNAKSYECDETRTYPEKDGSFRVVMWGNHTVNGEPYVDKKGSRRNDRKTRWFSVESI